MAQQNLRAAADVADATPTGPASSGSTTRRWPLAGRRRGDVHPLRRRARRAPAGRRFHRAPSLGLRRYQPEQYPLLLHFPYFDLYRKQVVKQADLVLAMHLCRDAFTAERRPRNFDYYEGLTVRDSSLSAAPRQSRRRNRPPRAGLRLPAEAALMDLDDLEHNTRTACTSRRWPELDRAGPGLGRDAVPRPHPSFAPRLPPALTRLAFTIILRGCRLRWR